MRVCDFFFSKFSSRFGARCVKFTRKNRHHLVRLLQHLQIWAITCCTQIKIPYDTAEQLETILETIKKAQRQQVCILQPTSSYATHTTDMSS